MHFSFGGKVQYASLVSLIVTFASIPGTSADWQYKSRPDLSPPILNITIPAQNTSEGYIFIAPYSGRSFSYPTPHGPAQPAPYIFTDKGELVWSGFGYVNGWAANFQAAKWRGKDVLFAHEGNRNTLKGHSHGHVKILDQSYETIKELRAGNHRLSDLHEFHIVDEKTALVESYTPIPYDLSAYGGSPEAQWIINAEFQELDIQTGRLLFRWSSLDHVLPSESQRSIQTGDFGNGVDSANAFDYFHINSIDRDHQHNYLISSRSTSTIFKINGTDGSIIWRLGGKYSNFTLGEGVEFGLQHHARFHTSPHDETEIISLFDNSGASLEGKQGEYENKSSGKLLSLDTRTWTATLIKKFPAPDGIFAFSQGSTQILPNGGAFVNWGSGGAVTEFDDKEKVVFHAYLESGELWKHGDVQNYRGFRYNWTGSPIEIPAIVALEEGEETRVFVSWNGDTRTKIWRLYGEDEEGEKIVKEEERTGFETAFVVQRGFGTFWAEAVDHVGRVLVTTQEVGPEAWIERYVSGQDAVQEQGGRDGTIEELK